jgi:hypothetical protein
MAAACGRARAVRQTKRAQGSRTRPDRDRDRGDSGQRPGKAARAPTPALLAVASDAHPHAAVDVVSIWSRRRGIRVRHSRRHRAARNGAGAITVGKRRRVLARAYRRPLPKRRRGRDRDRDRIGPAGHALAVTRSGADQGSGRRLHHCERGSVLFPSTGVLRMNTSSSKRALPRPCLLAALRVAHGSGPISAPFHLNDAPVADCHDHVSDPLVHRTIKLHRLLGTLAHSRDCRASIRGRLRSFCGPFLLSLRSVCGLQTSEQPRTRATTVPRVPAFSGLSALVHCYSRIL